MAFVETQKLLVELDLKGNLNAKLGDAARAIKGFDRATSNTQQSLSKFGRNLERGIVLGATAAAGGFIAVAKAAGDFEAQMNTIATIVDRKDIPKIGADLRKTAVDTGLSLDDLTSAYYDLASAGIKGQLATSTLNNAVALGIGGLATTAETVNLLSTAINAYGLDAAGAQKATDQFALAIADGVVHADQIAASFSNVASVAKAYGVGIDQIATSYAFLTAQGVDAAEVTTEMQRAIVSLISPSSELAAAGKKLGVNWENEVRKKGLVPTLDEIRTYADKTHTPLIDLLGRIEAVKYTLQTTGPQAAGFAAELEKMGKASGTAAAQMAERQKGLNTQLAILKAGLKDAAITIGTELLPKLTPLVKRFSDFLKLPQTQGAIRDFATKLADGFTKLVDAIGKVDWQPFIDGLKLSGDIAKTVISAFRSLPEDLQKLVIAGFALNKVTGGLGTSIAKDVGGALLNQFAGRGSSPANPLWVASVTGGVPGIPGGGTPGAPGGFDWRNAIAQGAVTGSALAVLESPGVKALWADIKAQNDAKRGGSAFTPEVFGPAVPGQALSTTARILPGITGPIAAAIKSGLSSLRNGKDDVVNIAQLQKGTAALLSDQFKQMIAALKGAKSPAEIQAAVKATVESVIGKGRGDVDSTRQVLATLKAQLKNTHDPATAAVLRSAIAKVEGKLPGRAFAQRELRAAEATLQKNESTDRKIGQLKSIEQALKDRGLPHAAGLVAGKIDALKREQVYAARATTEAIKDKDMTPKVTVHGSPITVNVKTTVADQISSQTTFKKAGNVYAL